MGDLSIILSRKVVITRIIMDMNLHVVRPSRKLGDSCAYGRIWIMSLLLGIVTELGVKRS